MIKITREILIYLVSSLSFFPFLPLALFVQYQRKQIWGQFDKGMYWPEFLNSDITVTGFASKLSNFMFIRQQLPFENNVY